MFKKLLFTSVALLSLTNVAFGTIYEGVNYTESEGVIKSGTKSVAYIIDANQRTQLEDPAVASLNINVDVTWTYTNVNEYYTLTPLENIEGVTDIILPNYTEQKKGSDQRPKQTLQVKGSSFVSAGVINTNSASYKEYARLCKIVKDGFYDEYVDMWTGDAEITDILTGSEIKKINSSKTTDDTQRKSKLFDDLYYRTKRVNSNFIYAYPIQDITLFVVEGFIYNGYNLYYQIVSLPKGFIDWTTESLSIPASLTDIELNAFEDAENLNTITTKGTLYRVTNGILYKYNSSTKTYQMIFVTPDMSNRDFTLGNTYTSIREDAFVQCSNVTIYSEVLPSKEYSNGNKVVNTATSVTVSAKQTISTSFANDISYYTVTGKVEQSDIASILTKTKGANYVDFTNANISGSISISSVSNDYNTLYIFKTTNNVSGTNVVNNGNCASLVLNENDYAFYSPIDFHADQVKVNRSVGGNWSTFCWPFSLTGTQATTFASKFKYGFLDSYKSEGNIFNFTMSAEISAYMPNVIKARSGSSTTIGIIENVNVGKTPTSEMKTDGGNGGYFIGALKTKSVKSNSTTASYVFSNNAIRRAEDAIIGTFRCYMTAPNQKAGAGAMRIVDFDDNEIEYIEFSEETGIEAIFDKDNNSTVYNMSGQRVENTKSGINVVNGKKVIIK